jgi:RNA polymerase sigma factor (sigma-70 family)
MGLLPHNEDEAWDSYRNGDDRMLGAIYSAYASVLYRYGLKFTRNTSLVEDSIQEIFLELHKNRCTIGRTDNILRYLLKSFRRKLFRILEREKRYDHKSRIEDHEFDIKFSIEHDIILDENARIRTELFRKALTGLSARQKEIIYFKYTAGLGYEEISEIMEMSIESCRNLLCRAVRTLKKVLQPNRTY